MLAIKDTIKTISKDKKVTQLGMELAFIDKDAEIKGGKYIIESNIE